MTNALVSVTSEAVLISNIKVSSPTGLKLNTWRAYTLREVDLFAQSTYKHAVLLTTLNIYSRFSLRALGSPFGSPGVCWCSTHPVSPWGLVVRAKTPYRHLQSRIIPGQIAQPIWLACFPPASCKSSSSHHTNPVLCSSMAPEEAVMQREHVLPHTLPMPSCASMARMAGRARLVEPKAVGVHSLQLLHISLPFLSRKAGKQREPFPAITPSWQTAKPGITWSLHRLPRKSPAELYHNSHLKRVCQNYVRFTTAAASMIGAVGWARPAQKWHLLNKPTASAG